MQNFSQAHILRLFSESAFLLVLICLSQFLYRGVSTRLKFRNMRKQGFPVPEPYSFILGHISFMKELKKGLPKDAHSCYSQRRIAVGWQKFFPQATKCPPIIYLDLWPFLSQPLILVTSPEACYQLTQENPQPRDSTFRWAMFPVTRGKDLISMNTADHRIWRSRFNPGFSLRNITLQMPILLEEVGIFAQQLKSQVGINNQWGELFTLNDRTISLTFDIIMRTALDLRLNEQTEGPSPILKAMRQLLTHVKSPNLWTKLERLGPGYRRDVEMQNGIIRNQLLPQIQSQLAAETSSSNHKTVISLALQEFRSESDKQDPKELNSEFIDIVESQLRLFISAGHDTTAQAICWILYRINSNIDILTRLRAEHDEILGANPGDAVQTLSQHPHKLNHMPYTTAVIKEALRIHPLGSTFRRGSPDFYFVCDGLRYPTENALIQTNPTVVHLRSDLWPRATEFLPERFLVAEDHPLHPVKNAWRAFELGHTRCIGEELAMMEMKLALVLTVRELEFDFDWEGWHKLQKRMVAPDTIDSDYGYRAGDGVGYVKDYLPTRVKLR
ncbi:cytochrome P450 [Daldinia caldariorum]|uniref:cytochrome P450 n=1 Tax=Daldinia caldariorum TaxID=326644 RepID=UPI0020083648|nr:cytochrome P450 [Daldinia caldariorum]KAI1470981.1 cytochrome P450 [Daldinia caldariorum]